MKRKIELIWLRIREYFKHPAEEIRQARPIVPGRLYSNFGYICKAIRYRPHEQEMVDNDQNNESGLSQEILLEQVKCVGLRNQESIKAMQQEADNYQTMPAKCRICAFQQNGIPCPVYNELADGTIVCDTHKYIILKNQH